MREAWFKNEVPEEWLKTNQILIPKNPNPFATNDFRRISLTNIGYKIYASTKVLEETTDNISFYQAGFMHSRSREDHIFSSRRILE